MRALTFALLARLMSASGLLAGSVGSKWVKREIPHRVAVVSSYRLTVS